MYLILIGAYVYIMVVCARATTTKRTNNHVPDFNSNHVHDLILVLGACYYY